MMSEMTKEEKAITPTARELKMVSSILMTLGITGSLIVGLGSVFQWIDPWLLAISPLYTITLLGFALFLTQCKDRNTLKLSLHWLMYIIPSIVISGMLLWAFWE